MKVIDPSPPRAPVSPDDEMARGDIEPITSTALLEFKSMPCGHLSAFTRPIVVNGLEGIVAPRRRTTALELTKALCDDADEVLSGTRGPVVAGD